MSSKSSQSHTGTSSYSTSLLRTEQRKPFTLKYAWVQFLQIAFELLIIFRSIA